MRTITVRKNNEFSANSRIYLHTDTQKIHIKGFKPYTIQIERDGKFYASHLWTQSNRTTYSQIDDNSEFIIVPRLKPELSLITLAALVLSLFLFFKTGSKWLFIPLAFCLVYIALYLTALKNRFLIIKPVKKSQS